MRAVAVIFVSLHLFPVSAFAQGEGIFAEFTTSAGSFTCRLDYAAAPKAVASFVGLATGERAWIDLRTGAAVRRPFYDGLTFHRTITNFMIQGGSPNGLGTDGPGYMFVDEFSPALRHDGFGVLSMANAGPDSNGSQFFITVSPQPHLDDVHTVFGRLAGGSNVVYAISQSPTGANNKPLEDVVIQTVTIRRVGAAAEAFNIHGQGLALVTNVPLAITHSGGNVSLTFSNQLYAHNRFYVSTNLQQWTGTSLGIVTGAAPNSVLASAAPSRRFFRMAQAQYPPTLYVPPSVGGRTITFTFTNGIYPAGSTNQVTFDLFGGGTYASNVNGSGTVIGYNWVQDPYRGRLSPIVFSGSETMTMHLDFDSATAGTFKGFVLPPFNIPASGTFTASP